MAEVNKEKSAARLSQLVKAAGPRPDELAQIKRITGNPASLRALTNPVTGAPPRVDDPVWNPASVQARITGAAVTGGAVGSLAAYPALAGMAGFSGAAATHLSSGIGTDAASRHSEASVVPGLYSDKQRMRDAEDIMAGRQVRPSLWSGRYTDSELNDALGIKSPAVLPVFGGRQADPMRGIMAPRRQDVGERVVPPAAPGGFGLHKTSAALRGSCDRSAARLASLQKCAAADRSARRHATLCKVAQQGWLPYLSGKMRGAANAVVSPIRSAVRAAGNYGRSVAETWGNPHGVEAMARNNAAYVGDLIRGRPGTAPVQTVDPTVSRYYGQYAAKSGLGASEFMRRMNARPEAKAQLMGDIKAMRGRQFDAEATALRDQVRGAYADAKPFQATGKVPGAAGRMLGGIGTFMNNMPGGGGVIGRMLAR